MIMHWHLRNHLHLLRHHYHLLLKVFNESRFIHWNAMFPLQFVSVVNKKRFVTGKLFLNRVHWHFVDCLLDLKRFHCLK